jgi:two-component system cell cycle sensor histidine kinase/response regulator CckA
MAFTPDSPIKPREERSSLRQQLEQAQKLESIGRLAGGIAHDFNNLLTVINGYSALLLKRLTPSDPAHRMVDDIRKAGQRGTELTRQLLLRSRKQVTQTDREVNLNDIIVEVEKMLTRLIGANIRLVSVLAASLGYVFARRPRTNTQVLMNLGLNARDAMPAGGTLLIETRNVDMDENSVANLADVTLGPYVELKVSDTGNGMTKEVRSHLFEPFFTTKRPGEGTGRCLARVYGIVRQSGGAIIVSIEPGEGTVLTIYLPRVNAGLRPEQEPEPLPACWVGQKRFWLWTIRSNS